MRHPPIDQIPIEKEENNIRRWDRKRDGDPEYRKYWNEVGRPLRRKMIVERDEKRRQKAKKEDAAERRIEDYAGRIYSYIQGGVC
ncbi:hypothetical protein Hanom_Chr10g00911381 [Helianthus anomalus]